MAVVYYQVFIFVTLVAVRLIFPRRLLTAALIWSALTVINLFYPPLIIVQLIVIWGAFGFLSSGTTPAPSARPAAVSAKSATTHRPQAPAQGTEAPPEKGSIRAFAQDLNERLSAQATIQEALLPVKRAVFEEKLRIECALKNARSALESNRQLLSLAPGVSIAELEEIRAKVSAAVRDVDRGEGTDKLPEIKRVDLNLSLGLRLNFSPHDPSIRTAIVTQHDEMVEEYAKFLAGVVAELGRSPGLRTIFEAKMRDLGALDQLTRIGDFEANRYWQSRNGEQALRAVLKFDGSAREIPHVVHFTRAANLRSILAQGLLPIDTAIKLGANPRINDQYRWDGHTDATSISIGFPNDKMLWKYRQEEPSEDWAVLIITPSVLWDKKCAFCKHNAADNRIRKLPVSDLMTLAAFQGLFGAVEGARSREEQGLLLFDPTDVQAEVLVFDVIEPSDITGVVFEKNEVLAAYADCLGGRNAHVDPEGGGFFEPRTTVRARRTSAAVTNKFVRPKPRVP